MPPVGFEPTISAGERPQSYALDRAATGTGGSIGIGNEIKRRIRSSSHKTYLNFARLYVAKGVLQYSLALF